MHSTLNHLLQIHNVNILIPVVLNKQTLPLHELVMHEEGEYAQLDRTCSGDSDIVHRYNSFIRFRNNYYVPEK